MKFKTLLILTLVLLATPAVAEEESRSYYQYTPSQQQNPQNKTLPPMSHWNSLITTTKDGKVYKSYFQYGPNNDVLKPGSSWNPIRTEKVKK
jgi:hypothetical protein